MRDWVLENSETSEQQTVYADDNHMASCYSHRSAEETSVMVIFYHFMAENLVNSSCTVNFKI